MAWNWTAATWRNATKHGKWWRSSEFNAIETAIGKYNAKADAKIRLERLQAILVAIAHWWSWKQDKKFGHKDDDAKGLPQGAAPRKYAASEATLQDKLGGQDFSARVDSVRGLVKDVVGEIDDVLALDRSAWGTKVFTDPKNPTDDFMYLVSAQLETPVKGEPAYRINTIKNPDLIANALISASVIKKGNVVVWGPAGFILSAPKRCIAAAAAQDLAAASAVGLKHEVEKYIELLRLYLRTDKLEGNMSLPKPGDVLPKTLNHHSEVVVLGKSYDKVTKVVGIYVLVDKDGDPGTQPGTCYRQISQFYRANPPLVKYVVEPLPLVTPARMQLYQDLHDNRDMPIVPIPIDKDTQVHSFDGLYEGPVSFRKDVSMVLHGSDDHRQLEEDARAKRLTKLVKYDKHGACRICDA